MTSEPSIVEIRFHGRGGQGAVTAAQILAKAAVREGKYAQAFPMFGMERRGAPVQAFARISDGQINIRSNVYEPDIIVVLDRSLAYMTDVTFGLKKGGLAIFNSPLAPDEVRKRLGLDARVVTVDATKIALSILGRSIVNTAMLGALVKATGLVKMETLEESIRESFAGEIGDKNVEVVRRAHEEVMG